MTWRSFKFRVEKPLCLALYLFRECYTLGKPSPCLKKVLIFFVDFIRREVRLKDPRSPAGYFVNAKISIRQERMRFFESRAEKEFHRGLLGILIEKMAEVF